MSYGYGVGEIIALSQLAWRTYKACREAPESFGSISQEALSLHAILLEATEVLVEPTDELSARQREGLKTICEGCTSVLSELDAIVEKYDSLGTSSKRAWDRMKYQTEKISDLRSRLVSNTVLLTAFITNTQVVVERKLHKLLKEFQQGKRNGSAVSMASIDSLTADERRAWRDVRKALEDIGITPEAFETNKGFITRFLKDAIEGGKMQEQADPQDQSTSEPATILSGKKSDTFEHLQLQLVGNSGPTISARKLPRPKTDKTSSSAEFLRGLWKTPSAKRASIWSYSERKVAVLAAQRSKEIDEVLKRNQKAQEKTGKMLLLGAGQAGKSTLLNQISRLYGDGFSEDDMKSFRSALWSNLLDAFRILVTEAEGEDLKYLDPNSHEAARAILAFDADELANDSWPAMDAVENMQLLWKEPCIRELMKKRNLICLPDNLPYLYSSVVSVVSPEAPLTDDIIFHTRIKTTGLSEVPISIGSRRVCIWTAGGSRSQRKKWVQMFGNVTTIVFLVALSSYDEVLQEAPEVNQITEALLAFESIIRSVRLENGRLTLVFTKLDLFLAKLDSHPFKTSFPDFKGLAPTSDNYKPAMFYIVRRFLDLVDGSREVSVHSTNATKTSQVAPCLKAIFHKYSQDIAKWEGMLEDSKPEEGARECCEASSWASEEMVRTGTNEDGLLG